MEPLATPGELTEREQGDPAAAVEAATGEIRGACGWHIAPSLTETLTSKATGVSLTLFLRSLYLTAVTEVRDPEGAVVDPDLYEWSPAGFLTYLAGVWPAGRYDVDVVHGHEAVPHDLRNAVLELAARLRVDPTMNLASKMRGPFSEQYRDDGMANVVRVVGRYRLRGGRS